jgi:hypothetical protein
MGFNLSKEFRENDSFEPLTWGPKLGIGVGTKKPGTGLVFYDVLVKIRYTFGERGDRIRPYADMGPGVLNYEAGAFQVEGGGGIDYYVGGGTFGINAQYKELVNANKVDRGVAILGTLGYHF